MQVVDEVIEGQVDFEGREKAVERPETYVQEIRLGGSEQLSLEMGGKRPTKTVLALSGKARVDGSYRKGDRVTLEVEVLVVGVSQKDKLDKDTGTPVECDETITGVAVDMAVLEDEQ